MQQLIHSSKLALATMLLTSLFLSGCATEYPCGEASAGHCASVSENYQRSFHDYKNPDDKEPDSWYGSSSQSQDSSSLDSGANSGNNTKTTKIFPFTKYAQVPVDGSPMISRPTMLRVWLTPYTDNDSVYHDQGYEYMITDKGHWLYANNFKSNTNLKNISLVQGTDRVNANAGGSGLPLQNSLSKATNPSTFLSDYPALSALKNQSVSVMGNPTNLQAESTSALAPFGSPAVSPVGSPTGKPAEAPAKAITTTNGLNKSTIVIP